MKEAELKQMEFAASNLYLDSLDNVTKELGVEAYGEVIKKNFSELVTLILPQTLRFIQKENRFFMESVPTLMDVLQKGIEALALKNGLSQEAIDCVLDEPDNYEICSLKMRFVVEAAFKDDAIMTEKVLMAFASMAGLCVERGVL